MRTIHRRHRDRQRAYPAGMCDRCGGELYPGDVCWLLGGRRLCRACAPAWLLEELAFCRREAGR